MWNLARITDPSGAKNTFIYNEYNRLGRIRNANGDVIRYKYDAVGNRTQVEDANGAKTTYAYNPTGEVAQIQYADGKEVRLSYNALRQLEEIEDWLGITRIENNARGQATKVMYPNGSEAGNKTTYTYSVTRALIGVRDALGNETAYTYDVCDCLIEVQQADIGGRGAIHKNGIRL